MPHQCTDCGRTFADGSKEMLSGCPDCGGNTFQYSPEGFDAEPPTEDPPEPPEPPVDSSVARTVGNAATAVRDLVGSGSSPPEPAGESPQDAGADPADFPTGGPEPDRKVASETVESEAGTDAEDAAQASARTDIVEDLPPAPESATTTASSSAPAVPGDRTREPASESESAEPDRPGLDALREELNDQFESIRILAPGQYELNLMELYDREEYIIALQEDGKYTIQVPERWEE